MIDATQNLIWINGENKTLQIEEIGRDDAGRFNVKYRGSSKVYSCLLYTSPSPRDTR